MKGSSSNVNVFGERRLRLLLLGVLVLVLVLLALVLLQIENLEARFASQGQELRALGEATDRLGARVHVPADSARATPAPFAAKLRHPDVPNFFTERDTHFPAAGASRDGVLVRGMSFGDPKGFNPVTEHSSVPVEFIHTYVGLPLGDRNAWTDPSRWHGEAAVRLEVTEEGKELTFYLRPDLAWHRPSGVDLENPRYAWLRKEQPLTTADYVFTLDMIRDAAVSSGPLRAAFSELESWKADGPLTLVLRWKKKQYTNLAASIRDLVPVPKFLYAFDEDGRPFPTETLGARFNRHWYDQKGFVGVGPYRMASYTPGSRIVLERNERFPGEKPALKTLVYPIYTDPNQTLVKLAAGDIDFGEIQAGQYREQIQRRAGAARQPGSPFLDGRIRCEPVPELSYRFVGWNLRRPYFTDKRVRRALTHAFDRSRILESVYAGLGSVTTHPFPPASPYADPSVAPLPFDLAAARRLLAEAGWTDSDGDGLVDKALEPGARRSAFEFSVLVGGQRKETLTTAEIFREDLLKIGVKMNVEAVEGSLLMKRSEERAFDAVFAAWTMSWEPDLFPIWHSSQAEVPKGSNRVGFRNADADRLIEALRETFDDAERTKLFRAFHRLLDDEAPVSFFMNPKLVYCHRSELENVTFSKVYPRVNALPWWSRRKAP